ncbi:MAG: tetratricopeptide repeat protein [Acidobacteriota bacterium]
MPLPSLRVLVLAVAVSLVACVGGDTDEPAADGAPRDLLLITIDTLRADTLGFMGHPSVSTPVLDALAERGHVFTNAHAHNVVTLPSHTNILTGLYPYQHGIRDNTGFVLGDDVPTLASILDREGWATGAVVAAFPLDRRYGLARGFDLYDDDYPRRADATAITIAERRGDAVVAIALDWWRAHQDERRFLWIHLYDPHAPYAPEPRFLADDPYLGEIVAVDSYLEPLLKPILGGEDSSTMVVMTSDHGEALGQHGEETHGLFAYEPTLWVPLVIAGPGIEATRDERSVAHIDLLPTMLAAVDIEPPEGLPGGDLFGTAELGDREIYFEAMSTFLNRGWAPLKGVLAHSDKYIDLPIPELYDLEVDAGETTNLVESERRRYNRLRQAIPEAAQALPSGGAVSEEEASKLRALGYLSGSATDKVSFGPEDDPKNLIHLDRQLNQLVELYRQGDLATAEQVARAMLVERPDMPLVVEHLSLILRQQEKLTAAIEVLEAALERGVEGRGLVRNLGLTLAEVGRARDAVDVLEPLVADGSDDGSDLEMLTALGLAYSDDGRHADGIATLERALVVDADWEEALETLGVVHLRRGDLASSRRALERALAVSDRLPIAWNTLGVVRYQEGDPDAAMAAWRRALELDPQQWDALFNLGLTAASLGRRDEARQALEQYIATAPPSRFAPDIARAREVLGALGAF